MKHISEHLPEAVATLQRVDQKAKKSREEAFNTLRNNKYPIDPNFRWVCQDTRQMAVTEMSTFHLFNALKMIWNHTVPERYWILPRNPYNLRGMHRTYRQRAISNLFCELMNRADRTQGMDDALRQMAAHMGEAGGKKLISGSVK
jgi:hypothetical protein